MSNADNNNLAIVETKWRFDYSNGEYHIDEMLSPSTGTRTRYNKDNEDLSRSSFTFLYATPKLSLMWDNEKQLLDYKITNEGMFPLFEDESIGIKMEEK